MFCHIICTTSKEKEGRSSDMSSEGSHHAPTAAPREQRCLTIDLPMPLRKRYCCCIVPVDMCTTTRPFCSCRASSKEKEDCSCSSDTSREMSTTLLPHLVNRDVSPCIGLPIPLRKRYCYTTCHMYHDSPNDFFCRTLLEKKAVLRIYPAKRLTTLLPHLVKRDISP